jgi:redox-sensitive bicupin YhaK (pirin superfamily)
VLKEGEAMIHEPRRVEMVFEPQQVTEGAGVRLKRSIGTRSLNYLDPFLLLDHFASDDPDDYKAGFPLHPHRGIETVTYLLKGEVRHRDTLGNSGSIGVGDVQWMTAAGGIMHEEMPQVRPEGIDGFQLWVNLPARLKMTRPRYQNIAAAEIPRIEVEGGAVVRVVAGSIEGLRGLVSGPVQGIAADPTYLDVELPLGVSFIHPVPSGHNAFAYVYQGEVDLGGIDSSQGRRSDADAAVEQVESLGLAVLTDGDYILAKARKSSARFLLVSGRPLNEPIARYGPFVMNTRDEIAQALTDLENGTFVWSESPVTG